MDGTGLAQQVEDFFDQLMAAGHRWTAWLAQQESTLFASQSAGDAAQLQAEQILGELNGLQKRRAELLKAALQNGFEATSLITLAQRLPQWSSASGRARLRQVQTLMFHVQRLHYALWVLVSHCASYTNQTMQLLTHGMTEGSTYAVNDRTDLSGGQLLDTLA